MVIELSRSSHLTTFVNRFNIFVGVYTYLFEKFSNKDGTPPGFFRKAGLGMSAGACGAFIGTPAEIALIRMTADGNLPAAERRYDNHVIMYGKISVKLLKAIWDPPSKTR